MMKSRWDTGWAFRLFVPGSVFDGEKLRDHFLPSTFRHHSPDPIRLSFPRPFILTDEWGQTNGELPTLRWLQPFPMNFPQIQNGHGWGGKFHKFIHYVVQFAVALNQWENSGGSGREGEVTVALLDRV